MTNLEIKEDVLSFQDIYLDSMNREQTAYCLDRELTVCAENCKVTEP
jgi:hypothetical protein